ncbi:exodeoxyribonuclease VII small subunit [Nodularia harveyana UHCC-0300]|uniref:Exodeoxyribonuclease 7 small subunit n=1 Tax=Nodularia harveyana UHCC-0300 TaxID=2974287 RepID=A0ABU5U9M8_9CYAN|nr:exodeoxyribonuclease VII small subunit [Nodularia harveyana]MEA5580222.1 exodeoxyribonuclease VII small subunit [Nodularia harveyana UHCC-0300]
MVKRKGTASSDLMAGGNYEQKVREIEEIIARIEAGELDLEEVFDQFSTAVQSLGQCESFLQQRQQQVNLLIETLTDES